MRSFTVSQARTDLGALVRAACADPGEEIEIVLGRSADPDRAVLISARTLAALRAAQPAERRTEAA